MERRILLIDDDATTCELMKLELASREYDVVTLTSADAALRQLAAEDFGVVITDINMRGMTGVDLCRQVVALRQETPVIVMTAFASLEVAVASIRAGAYDFVTKPFQLHDLVLTIERALKHRELREEVRRLRREVDEQRPFEEIIGASAPVKRMCDLIARVADSEATVLVTGESGTGKELVANALHRRSARSRGPFVAINCAAMPEALLESELFGHVKGAFTDARGTRTGLFAKANGGTLFLDEVAEMPLGMQAKLLRAVQERTVRMVGGDTEVPFDTRIVAATNRDLEKEVLQRRFREDLFHRLDVVRIHVPPLRDRENDTLRLAQHFLRRSQGAEPRIVGLTRAAADRLTSHSWPGNVRELQNCMERAVVLAQFDHIGIEDLPERISECKPTALPFASVDSDRLLPMDEIEQRYIRQVLEAVGGNKASAARVLGFDRRTLYRKLDRWRAGSEVDSHGAAAL